jgi:hypothetical protein
LLEKLGFIINYEKSQTTPSNRSKFLGFILDSTMMKVELPESKRRRISQQIKGMKISKAYSIREFASIIGSLGACCPAVKYGWVYMKDLERENGWLSKPIMITSKLKWWFQLMSRRISDGGRPISGRHIVQLKFHNSI